MRILKNSPKCYYSLFLAFVFWIGLLPSGFAASSEFPLRVAQLTPSPQPRVLEPRPTLHPSPNFEKFENYAIEMVSKQVSISYFVKQHKYSTQFVEGQSKKICPGRSIVEVSYSLRNKTSKNYRFYVCLSFSDGKCIAPKLVTFIGSQTIYVKHLISLPQGSGHFTVQSHDILTSINDDTTPSYFSGQLEVKSPSCPASKICCESLPSGCCNICVKAGQPCP